MEEKRKIMLDNGVEIFYCNVPDKSYVAGALDIGSGSALEPYDKRGLAHFLEHMTFHGSRAYRSSRVQEAKAASLGFRLNASTHFSTIYYPFDVPKENVIASIDLLRDLMFHPIIRSIDIEREKKIVANECRRYFDSPQAQISKLFHQTFFRGTPLEEEVIGREDHVESIVKLDVVNFHKSIFVASNLRAYLFGPVEESLLREVSERLGSLPKSKKPEKFKLSLPILLGNDRVEKSLPGIRQCYGAIAFRAPKSLSEDMPTMAVIEVLLNSEGECSLMQRIRHKLNLAYSINSDYRAEKDYGCLRIGFDCGPEDLERTLQESFSLLTTLNPSDASVEKARKRIAESYKQNMDNALNRFNIFIKESSMGFSVEKYLSHVEKVTKDKVKKAVKNVFIDSPYQLAIIRPGLKTN